VTLTETVLVLAKLSAAFPAAKVSEETASVYHEALADMPFQAVKQAVKGAILEDDFFPSVAELRRRAEAGGIDTKTAINDSAACYKRNYPQNCLMPDREKCPTCPKFIKSNLKAIGLPVGAKVGTAELEEG